MNPPTPLFAALLLAWFRSGDDTLVPAMAAAYDVGRSFADKEADVVWAVCEWTGWTGRESLTGLGILTAVDNAFDPRYGLAENGARAQLHRAKQRIISYLEYRQRVEQAEVGT